MIKEDVVYKAQSFFFFFISFDVVLLFDYYYFWLLLLLIIDFFVYKFLFLYFIFLFNFCDVPFWAVQMWPEVNMWSRVTHTYTPPTVNVFCLEANIVWKKKTFPGRTFAVLDRIGRKKHSTLFAYQQNHKAYGIYL